MYWGNDGPIVWEPECVMKSDVLIAICEYTGSKKKPKKKFRFSFHCGYYEPGIVILHKTELDVEDKR
jgi:hypothetical protein